MSCESDRRFSRTKWWWVGAAILVISTRVAVVLAPGLHRITEDTRAYFRQADALLDGGFVQFFPNGYPALIASVWSLTGEGGVKPLVLVSVLLSIGTVVCTFLLAREWFSCSNWPVLGPTLALVAITCWPNHLRFVPRLLSDIPATFFLMGGLLAVVRKRWLFAGVMTGVAMTIRTNLAPVWIVVLGLLVLREERAAARIVLVGGLLPIGVLLTLGYVKTGDVGLGGNLKYNLLKSVLDDRWGLGFSAGGLEAKTLFGAVGAYVRYAVEQPVHFLGQRLYALWQLWGPWPMGGFSSVYSRLAVSIRFPLVVFAGYGFWRRRWEWTTWLIATPFFVVTIVHTIFFGLARFGIPAEPGLIILAAEGLLGLLTVFWKSHPGNQDQRSSALITYEGSVWAQSNFLESTAESFRPSR